MKFVHKLTWGAISPLRPVSWKICEWSCGATKSETREIETNRSAWRTSEHVWLVLYSVYSVYSLYNMYSVYSVYV